VVAIDFAKIAGIVGSGAVGAIVTLFALTGASHVNKTRNAAPDEVQHPRPMYKVDGKERMLSVGRSSDLSFHVEMIVRGKPVRALVDTGANITVLTAEDAARIGVPPGLSVGSTDVKGITRSVRQFRNIGRMPIGLGPIMAWDVPVSVDDSGELQNSILGQDAFCGIKSIRIESNTISFVHDSPIAMGCKADFAPRVVAQGDADK
jgi:clan AA aspartic protease (TIGR02281 family)